MSCGGRVYKGDTVTISVPFEVDDYSNLTITYSTIGDEKIVLTEDEVEIEDGFITHTFQGHDLDLLPDGVIYYTISCDVLGVPNVDSTNTNLYLKTPAGYSGRTADEIYQDGYEAGLEDCSGGTPCDCSSAYTEGYHDGEIIGKTEGYTSGYTDGYNQGQADCPECSGGSCNLQSKNAEQSTQYQSYSPDEGYDGIGYISVNAGPYGDARYDDGYQSGYTHATEVERSYLSGITITQNGVYTKLLGGYNRVIVNVPSGETDCSEAFQSGYTEGYNQGQADCPECPTNIQGTANRTMTQEGETFYPDEGYDGMGSVYVDGSGLYQSAYTEGYNQGIQACQDLWGGIWCADENWDGQEITLTPADFASTGAGFSSITISDCGYGQSKYDEGFADGQASCPECSGTSCNLVPGQFELCVGWPGSETINPPATADGFSSFTIVDNGYYSQAYDAGWGDGVSSGRTVGRREGYYQGEQSVIQSFLTGNSVTNYGGIDDYGYVVAYYYTPSGQMCVITGYDRDCDERWDDSFSSMSVDGGPWVSPQLYYYLTEGWHQIRFNVKDKYLHYAFNHNFTIEYVEDPFGNEVIPYMDALKAVSLPEANSNQSGVTAITGTFKMNNGIRILSSSMKSFGVQSGNTYNGNALSGATNLNIIISHYQGNENVDIISEVQNGILFYPAGKSSTHSSALTGWTHMELF